MLQAYEITPGKEPPTDRVYCLQQPLTFQQTNGLLKLYSSGGMDMLSHQEKITGWNTELDGIIYLFESVQNGQYQFRTYWTPDKESPISEERLVYRFVDSASSLSGGARLRKVFSDNIPFYSWGNNTGTLTSRVVTWTQYRAMKKERKQYRKNTRRIKR